MNGTRLPQVIVFIQFSENCDITSNCQGTLSIQKYETSNVDTNEARSVDTYQLVERISLAGARENKTITVNLNSSHSSFYLAIQDEDSCIVVLRLIVFYYVCPFAAKMENLIHYTETIAPPFPFSDQAVSKFSITVNATCVENAEPESELPLKLACSPGGIWDSASENGSTSCRCVLGHYNDSGACICKPVQVTIICIRQCADCDIPKVT